MKIFSYTIVGRQPGNVHYSTYSGVVRADLPKEALLAALDDCFGDKDDGPSPYERLTNGWCDKMDLEEWWDLPGDTSNWCLDTGENTYDIDVNEVPSDATITALATADAPEDIDDIRAADRVVGANPDDPDGLWPLEIPAGPLLASKADLPREVLEEITVRMQCFLFGVFDANDNLIGWTDKKDVSGADFIEYMSNMLGKYGLVPDGDYPI